MVIFCTENVENVYVFLSSLQLLDILELVASRHTEQTTVASYTYI